MRKQTLAFWSGIYGNTQGTLQAVQSKADVFKSADDALEENPDIEKDLSVDDFESLDKKNDSPDKKPDKSGDKSQDPKKDAKATDDKPDKPIPSDDIPSARNLVVIIFPNGTVTVDGIQIFGTVYKNGTLSWPLKPSSDVSLFPNDSSGSFTFGTIERANKPGAYMGNYFNGIIVFDEDVGAQSVYSVLGMLGPAPKRGRGAVPAHMAREISKVDNAFK